jgi:cell division septation protein DedD
MEGFMIKAILGTIVILAGLGVAIYFLFSGNQAKAPAPNPPAQTQAAVHPAPETGQKPVTPTPQPPAASQSTAPASEAAAPPAVVPVPTPEPSQAEKEIAPLPTLEPKKEPGLVVGQYRRYKAAQRLLDKIKKKNLPGFIRKEGKHYKVWVGPFATPQEAERARKSLRTALKISPQKREYEVPVPK